jgi:hypothetical protein
MKKIIIFTILCMPIHNFCAQAKKQESGRDITGEITALVTDYAYDGREIELKDYPLEENSLAALADGRIVSASGINIRIWSADLKGSFHQLSMRNHYENPTSCTIFSHPRSGFFIQTDTSKCILRCEEETPRKWWFTGSHHIMGEARACLSSEQIVTDDYSYEWPHSTFIADLKGTRQTTIRTRYASYPKSLRAVKIDTRDGILVIAPPLSQMIHNNCLERYTKKSGNRNLHEIMDVNSYEQEKIMCADLDIQCFAPMQKGITVGCAKTGRICFFEQKEDRSWNQTEIGIHPGIQDITCTPDDTLVSCSKEKLMIWGLAQKKLIKTEVKGAFSELLKLHTPEDKP